MLSTARVANFGRTVIVCDCCVHHGMNVPCLLAAVKVIHSVCFELLLSFLLLDYLECLNV